MAGGAAERRRGARQKIALPFDEHPADAPPGPDSASGAPAVAGALAAPRWRVALVHDWLTGMRGGEKVLEVLCELWPQAELFTLVHVPGMASPTIEGRPVHRSIIQYLPLATRYYRQMLPFFPFAIEQFDLDRFDLVISTSHCAAKAALAPGRARHLCYCHTPMRYGWDQFDAYFGPERMGRLGSTALRWVMAPIARWDRATAARVDRFLANSRYVAQRIHRYYNRVSSVVYPPVDTGFFHLDRSERGTYFLVVSALVPYKRIETAIEACRLVNVPLRIAGDGPELERLAAIADGSVTFVGPQSADQIRDLYRGAIALLLPGEEDFGIAPVEAQACGRPVVALGRGGALETVIDEVTGILVSEDSVQSFADALVRVQRQPFEPGVLRTHALAFSRERFRQEMARQVDDLMSAPRDASRW
ncbi:MAG: glycosyltransferase [Acidobacteria bacterium]|nr:glycosyltransferase [Acidobacteriota bacterium]